MRMSNLMRRSIAGLALIAASATLLAQTSPWPFRSPSVAPAKAAAGSHSLTVTFWNIEWFPGTHPNPSKADEERQIKVVHEQMAGLNSDVIGMEEVRDYHSAEIAVQQLPGFKVDVCANFPPREGQQEAQQVAIASRLQPMSAWFELWQANGAVVPPRGFAFAAYEVAPHQMLLVYAVHLKSNRGDAKEDFAMREESIHQLLSHMKAMEKAYGSLGQISWLVGGDFNTGPDDKRFAGEKTVKTLMDAGFNWAWQNIPLAQRTTIPADKGFPAGCFDHIFYRGATLTKAWVTTTPPDASDHRPVSASFALSGAH
jgi:endonuclease/exonuclease/phosphatase (EEP) superfamily protein YafD